MDNEYTRKEKVCPLIGDYCDEEHKDCDRCIADENAWQRLQCYIDCHNYDWTFDRIKHDYQKYYLNGSYCSHTLMDIIENNKNDCEMLFGLEKLNMLNENEITTIHLGNGDIAITQTVDSDLDKISIMFSQLNTVGKLGELIENDVERGIPIGEIVFDNVDGLENLINILNILKKKVYRNNHFI